MVVALSTHVNSRDNDRAVSNLIFQYRRVGLVPHRMVYIARDDANRLYTIGLDIAGTNGFAAVYDPATLENLYAKTYFDCRMHADTLKKHLQDIANQLDSTPIPAH